MSVYDIANLKRKKKCYESEYVLLKKYIIVTPTLRKWKIH